MNRKSLLMSLFFLLMCLHFSIAQNLLSKGDFEEEGIDPLWYLIGSPDLVAFGLNTEDAISGSNCLQIDVKEKGNVAWAYQVKRASWPVEKGKKYITSFWAKASENGMDLNFTIGKTSSPYTEYATNYGLKLTTAWKKYSLVVEAPETTSDDITFAIHIVSIGTYQLDNFEVIEASPFISKASVVYSGRTVDLEFYDNLMDVKAESQLPFFVFNQNNEIKKIAAISTGTTQNVVKLEMEDRIYKDEEITVQYYPGTLSTELGVEVTAFTIQAKNNSNAKNPLTGIAQTKDQSGTILFPNPVSEKLSINYDKKLFGYQLYNQSGQLILSENLQMENNHTVDVSTLPSGVYFLKLLHQNDDVVIQKFIKR